ncbi:MAG: hypothetical protein ACYDIE_12025 [Candidatus Krumholzibacteriia bacterium]
MKRTLSLLAATLLLLSLAPVASATDGIGIYLDQAGTTNCSAAPAPYSAVTLYVVAKNISSTVSGLSGWECGILFDPVAPIGLSFTVLNGMLNVLSPPNFSVGGNPIAYADAMPLMTISFLYAGSPVKVAIGPSTPSSFGVFPWESLPPAPGYAVGDNPGDLRVLQPSSNTPSGTPLFFWVYYLGVPESCPGSPVGTEPSSWGSVKTLFK